MDNSHLYWIIGAGVIGLLYSFWKTGWINKQDEGTDKMKRIGADIAEGAMAFLKAEYRVLAIFVIVIAVLLGWANFGNEKSSVLISLSFVIGAFASGLAGFLGMRVATKANNRTTHAVVRLLRAKVSVCRINASGVVCSDLDVRGLLALRVNVSLELRKTQGTW
jgi:K(+)-stimulated pyrophosphate-energized sodium pump